MLQQLLFSSFAGLMLLSYYGEKGDGKSLIGPPQGVAPILKVKATSSPAAAQLPEEKRCRPPLRDGHSGAAHALLFQWFWDQSLKL